jgi:hypothetical protein
MMVPELDSIFFGANDLEKTVIRARPAIEIIVIWEGECSV